MDSRELGFAIGVGVPEKGRPFRYIPLRGGIIWIGRGWFA